MEYLQIINSIKEKDKLGLEALYNNYGAKLYSYARANWSFSEDDAWEIVYKTLYKIVEVIDRYDFQSEKHFQNWIYKIFKNELLQFYRKYRNKTSEKEFQSLETIKQELEISNKEWEEIIDGISLLDDSSMDDYLIKEESSNPSILAIEFALEQLEDFDKQILLLRAQGFNYEEIASYLGEDKKNLKVKYLRAKQKLLKLFGEKIKK